MKNIRNFHLKVFIFLVVKFSIYLNRCVFVMALDKALFPAKKYLYFSYFLTKTYVVCTHYKCLREVLLMSTHNICFCQEIRKLLIPTLI